MNHTGTSFYHRHTGRVAHEVDKALAAARYAEVYVANGIEQLGCGLVGGWQQSHNVFADAELAQHVVDKAHGSAV